MLKFRHGLAFDNPAQIAALRLGGVVLGELLRQVLEIGAGFGLFQDVFGLLPDLGDFSVGLADGLEQNMFYMDSVGDHVVFDVRVVIGMQSRVAGLRGAA